MSDETDYVAADLTDDRAGGRAVEKMGDEIGARRANVWALTAALTVGAAALAGPGMITSPASARPGAAWLMLLPLFALAEVIVIHLPSQREAHGHTLREVPAVLGLTFLAPQQYISVYVVGAVLGLYFFAHIRGVKLAFNAAMFGVEAGAGAALYHVLLNHGDPLSMRGWGAVMVAVVVTDLISAAAVTTAITVTEGSFDDEVLREALRSGLIAAFINACMALLVATLVEVRPSALPLLAVVVALAFLGYRSYAHLARGHNRTQLLYRFMERTSSASADELPRTVLRETAELLHAEHAFLVTRRDDGDERLTRIIDGHLSTTSLSTGEKWWAGASDGRLITHTRERATVPGIQAQPGLDPRDGLATRLSLDGPDCLMLVVCDRSFDRETFDAEDVRVFEALAAHAGVALERARTVEDLRLVAEERAREARRDPLTGLSNRLAFQEAISDLTRSQSHSSRSGNGVVLLLDLDDFKDINDTLGHSTGDRLLEETAMRLQRHAEGLVARLGGDEFAVLNPDMDLDAGLRHARELYEALCEPVHVDGVALSVAVSVGVARYSHAASAEDLLARAEVAMYSAKTDRSGVMSYRPSAGDSTARRMTLAAHISQALSSGEIHPWFQPQATCDGKVSGFEALVRWTHADFGMVSPAEIVAVAKRTGLVNQLSRTVVRHALAAHQRWSAAGYELDVSVNITAGDLADPSLPSWLATVIEEFAVPAAALTLEITEGDAIQDTDQSLEVLRAIRELGIQLSVDDFGTGYSSLAYLDQLPVHEVKIDQSFVFRLERDATDATIVKATVRLAHELGLRVVAEGVESELARALVTEIGVDLYQGYGLARPMPPADVQGWLDRWANSPATRSGFGDVGPSQRFGAADAEPSDSEDPRLAEVTELAPSAPARIGSGAVPA